jgi:hypothetical protein
MKKFFSFKLKSTFDLLKYSNVNDNEIKGVFNVGKFQ